MMFLPKESKLDTNFQPSLISNIELPCILRQNIFSPQPVESIGGCQSGWNSKSKRYPLKYKR